jgi:PPM family protein phosphatase
MLFSDEITCLNELGRRDNLEDSVYPAPGAAGPEDRLFLVCDGVGGENKGEIASQIASTEFAAYFRQFPPGTVFQADRYIGQAQKYVLEKMAAYADLHPDAQMMSTTLTLVYLVGESVLAAWCGDSRIYHLRDGQVLWRSGDHSLVGKLVEQGVLTEEEGSVHPQKNVILRSLSASGNPSAIETKWLTDIRGGDYILLCTDGVLEQMNEAKLSKIVTEGESDKRQLFLDYCYEKTNDNFSLCLLRLNKRKSISGGRTKKVMIVVALVLLGVLGLYAYRVMHKKPVIPVTNASIKKESKQNGLNPPLPVTENK